MDVLLEWLRIGHVLCLNIFLPTRSQAGQPTSGSCIPSKRFLSSRVVLGHIQPLGGGMPLVTAWHDVDHFCVVPRLGIQCAPGKVLH
jgi:hypothetical protein